MPRVPVGRKKGLYRQARARQSFSFEIERYEIDDAVQFVTFDSGHKCWKTGVLTHHDVNGRMVRLRPPGGLDTSKVERLERRCRENKALGVKVVRDEREELVVVDKQADAALGGGDEPPTDLRAAVMKALKTAQNVVDKKGVETALDEAMTRAGL